MFCPLCKREIGCNLAVHLKGTHKMKIPKDLGAWFREETEKLTDEFVQKYKIKCINRRKEMNEHKILIFGGHKDVTPKRYRVSIYCAMVDSTRELAEFFDLSDARKYGIEKAKLLGLKLEDKT